MNTMTDTVRREVKKRLIDLEMSQTELANQIGKSRQQINDMLNGRSGNINEAWKDALDALGLELVVLQKRGS